MKVNGIYTATGKKVCTVAIKMDITTELIEFIIADMLEAGEALTKKRIEDRIRMQLWSDGCIHFAYQWDRYSDETVELAKIHAEDIYPDFY